MLVQIFVSAGQYKQTLHVNICTKIVMIWKAGYKTGHEQLIFIIIIELGQNCLHLNNVLEQRYATPNGLCTGEVLGSSRIWPHLNRDQGGSPLHASGGRDYNDAQLRSSGRLH
jgi:hypothetical protein